MVKQLGGNSRRKKRQQRHVGENDEGGEVKLDCDAAVEVIQLKYLQVKSDR